MLKGFTVTLLKSFLEVAFELQIVSERKVWLMVLVKLQLMGWVVGSWGWGGGIGNYSWLVFLMFQQNICLMSAQCTCLTSFVLV